MKVVCSRSDTFHCSLERAFKAPILGDATKFLNGYFLQPPVLKFVDDETWGQEDGIRFPYTRGNLFLAEGVQFTDKILERNENESWKWTIYNFRPWTLFFLNRGVGHWIVDQKGANECAVTYSYTFYPKNMFTYAITWMFCQFQWKGMMRKAIKGIKKQAESKVEFIYK